MVSSAEGIDLTGESLSGVILSVSVCPENLSNRLLMIILFDKIFAMEFDHAYKYPASIESCKQQEEI